jgi:hypothetical protein
VIDETMRMTRKLLYAALVLATGVAVGALVRGGPEPSTLGSATAASMAGADADARASASEYARIIDGLSATLQLEVVERQRLEAQIEALGDKIGRLEGQLADARGPDPDFFVTAGDAAAADAEAEVDNAARAALAPFLEAGFDPERAEYVKQLQDELQLQRLYVRDQAEREGWIRTPRYREAMEAIAQREEGLQQELGEADYDRYLYSIGRPNRVLVGDVLANGPAQQAGIQVGDAILSYGGDRIYEAGSLVDATRDGTAGMSTAVEIERDGQTQLVYVPRGPLGINLRVARVRPEG